MANRSTRWRSIARLIALFWLLASAATGSELRTNAAAVQIIGTDYGGVLVNRMRALRALREQGVRVEVRGRHCFSTCTLYIGLPDVCILPDTIFGFHGPSRLGFPLAPDTFDHASRLIAAYYPPPLKRWYLAEGRFRTNGVYRINGAALIRMGVPACPEGPLLN